MNRPDRVRCRRSPLTPPALARSPNTTEDLPQLTLDDDDPHRLDDRGDDSDDPDEFLTEPICIEDELKRTICSWIEAAKVPKDAIKRGVSPADLPPYTRLLPGQPYPYPETLRGFTIVLFHALSLAKIAAPTDDVKDYVALVMSWAAGAPVTPHAAVEAFTRAELLLYCIEIFATVRPVRPATTVPTGVTDTASALLTDEDRRLNPPRDQVRKAQAELPDLVTLDQAAAMVHKSKRTLERHKTTGTLPAPIVQGGGGKADLYDWKVMRPWLTKTYGIALPEKYPRHREN
jgi:hypothetical protein